MKCENKIIKMIEAAKRMPVPVELNSHLYRDLALDSLSFIKLIVKIEKAFDISFALDEMSKCLEVKGLIGIVKNKREDKKINAKNHNKIQG